MTVAEQDFSVEPIWDALIAERDGRLPHEFEGHETWEDSEEAKTAEARGRAEAEATAEIFLGWDPNEPREWGPSFLEEEETVETADLDGEVTSWPVRPDDEVTS
jgi:hypothetical protein